MDTLIGNVYIILHDLSTVCFQKEKKHNPNWNGCVIEKNSIIKIIKCQRKKTKIYLVQDLSNGGLHICRKRDILKSLEYTCSICKKTFIKDWSDEEAIAEMISLYGEVPLHQCDIVCDDCFNLLGL